MNQLGFALDGTPASRPAKQYSIPRYQVSLVRDGSAKAPVAQIRSSRDARDVLATYLAGVDREHFVVLLLDQKNRIIGIHTVSTGSLTASVIHPREVLCAEVRLLESRVP